MILLRIALIASLALSPFGANGYEVRHGDQTYRADQAQVDQQSQGFQDQTSQSVGSDQRAGQINGQTQAQNIQGGGSGLGKSLIIAGAGSVAAALIFSKIGAKKVVAGTTEAKVGTAKASNPATAGAAPPWFKKAALSFAIAGGMMALSMLAARQGKANYDAASQAFDTAATSSWCGQVDCPSYNPNVPTFDPDPRYPIREYPEGEGGGSGNPSGGPAGEGFAGVPDGIGGPTVDTNGDGVPDAYSPDQVRARSQIKSMIAAERRKANALISELEKQGYKMSPDGKTLMTPKGPINPESMSSAEGMRSAGFSDEAIKEIEDQLKKANEEASKVAMNKEAELGGILGDDGSGGGAVAGMDPSTPGFDPSKYLKGLNLNGDPVAGARAPAGLAIQLSSGDSIGAKNDNIFAMVQRAYRVQQRSGRLGNLRQPAQQRAGPAGPAAPMGF